jgi:hypothetical protein
MVVGVEALHVQTWRNMQPSRTCDGMQNRIHKKMKQPTNEH